MRAGPPRFDPTVARGGYAWWYVDALSDDGLNGLTIIAFIGSVFSPYYAWSRRHGLGEPLNFCALNVVLYGRNRKLWTMTERGRGAVRQEPDRLTIGPSAMAWNGGSLTVNIDEVTSPLPSRLRGRVRVTPRAIADRTFALDADGKHRWRVIGPASRVEVEMDKPGVRWSGEGYLDTNDGDEPMEDRFRTWNWSRARVGEETVVFYDVAPREGAARNLALRYGRNGVANACDAPKAKQLKPGVWGMPRAARCEAGSSPTVVRRLEDAPFYTRSVLSTRLGGGQVEAMHESLSLDRFRAPWVQAMLPFKMPRRI